jgi:hypothetical protein
MKSLFKKMVVDEFFIVVIIVVKKFHSIYLTMYRFSYFTKLKKIVTDLFIVKRSFINLMRKFENYFFDCCRFDFSKMSYPYFL